jgi:lysosomal acid lipase/cholesteryl ester hydrolase
MADDEISTSLRICDAKTFQDLCRVIDLSAEEHTVTVKGPCELSLYRVGPLSDDDSPKSITPHKPVAFLLSGFGMTAKCFACVTEKKRSLVHTLVTAGYDVWIGSNRGTNDSPAPELQESSKYYWDFSLDELALDDLPTFIDYILESTGMESLCYVGFSQGTIQAFIALSLRPDLLNKINVMVAIAPALVPVRSVSWVVDCLCSAR